MPTSIGDAPLVRFGLNFLLHGSKSTMLQQRFLDIIRSLFGHMLILILIYFSLQCNRQQKIQVSAARFFVDELKKSHQPQLTAL